jgi:hypothetical protein
MVTFSAGGKAHNALSLLDTGPATLADLKAHSGLSPNASKKLWWLTGEMLRCGLITRTEGLYHMTDKGREALHVLRDGEDFCGGGMGPNVRVFQRKEAA